MAASDWAHFDRERGEWGYYTEDGQWWPEQGNPAHQGEVD